MSIKSLSIIAAATLALCAGAAQAATTNGFANGGFETAGVSPLAASWLPAAAGYSRSSAEAHSGSFSALLESPQFNAAVMLQNSIDHGGLPALTVGDTPLFSFWAKGFAGTTANLNYALRYLDGAGNIKANSGNQSFTNGINTSGWTQFTFNLGPVPVGATAAFVEFSQGLGPIEPQNGLFAGKVYIDDISLAVTAVPEPETYAMMLAGLVAVGAIARRRRQGAAAA